MKTKENKNLTPVKIQDIGLYIKVIKRDYEPKTDKELAELITTHIKVKCTETDILHYEGMLNYHEDYERESRRIEYEINPFEKYK